MDKHKIQDTLMRLLHFNAAALDANRAGKLADSQRKHFDARNRSTIRMILFWFVFCGIPGMLFLISGTMQLVGAILLLITTGWVYMWYVQLDRDLKAGQVHYVEGEARTPFIQLKKKHYLYPNGSTINIDRQSFEVSYDIRNLLKKHRYCRVYYLPHSKTIVAIEPLTEKAKH